MPETILANPRLWYLGLGSNLGSRAEVLQEALRRLDATDGITVIRSSSIYETAPWGDTDQGSFLNLVALVESPLPPLGLLAEVKRVERELGRRPRRRWGPREIDIDLLLADDLRVEAPGLTVPHPGLLERGFVLIPLAELSPDLRLPDGRAARELAHRDEGVRLWGPPPAL
jgi:2-amino-4-hydroxy-6-hydroxymethyldihydropteridine diphosphokinase